MVPTRPMVSIATAMVPTKTGMFSIATAMVVPRDDQEPVNDQGPGNNHGPGIEQIIAYVLLGCTALYFIVMAILTFGACGYKYVRGFWRKKKQGTDVEAQELRDMTGKLSASSDASSASNDASSSPTGSIGPYSRNPVATQGFSGEPGVQRPASVRLVLGDSFDEAQSVSKDTSSDDARSVSSGRSFHSVDLADPPHPKTSGRPKCSIL